MQTGRHASLQGIQIANVRMRTAHHSFLIAALYIGKRYWKNMTLILSLKSLPPSVGMSPHNSQKIKLKDRPSNSYILFSSKLFCFNFYFFISCVWVVCLHLCLCTTRMPSAHKYQNRVFYPLDLELEMALSPHVSAGN